VNCHIDFFSVYRGYFDACFVEYFFKVSEMACHSWFLQSIFVSAFVYLALELYDRLLF